MTSQSSKELVMKHFQIEKQCNHSADQSIFCFLSFLSSFPPFFWNTANMVICFHDCMFIINFIFLAFSMEENILELQIKLVFKHYRESHPRKDSKLSKMKF